MRSRPSVCLAAPSHAHGADFVPRHAPAGRRAVVDLHKCVAFENCLHESLLYRVRACTPWIAFARHRPNDLGSAPGSPGIRGPSDSHVELGAIPMAAKATMRLRPVHCEPAARGGVAPAYAFPASSARRTMRSEALQFPRCQGEDDGRRRPDGTLALLTPTPAAAIVATTAWIVDPSSQGTVKPIDQAAPRAIAPAGSPTARRGSASRRRGWALGGRW